MPEDRSVSTPEEGCCFQMNKFLIGFLMGLCAVGLLAAVLAVLYL